MVLVSENLKVKWATRFETAKKDSVKRRKTKVQNQKFGNFLYVKTNILILKPILLKQKVIFLAIL